MFGSVFGVSVFLEADHQALLEPGMCGTTRGGGGGGHDACRECGLTPAARIGVSSLTLVFSGNPFPRGWRYPLAPHHLIYRYCLSLPPWEGGGGADPKGAPQELSPSPPL